LFSATGNIATNLISLLQSKAVDGGWETRVEKKFVLEAVKKDMA
jgi:hypothetical protein